MLVTEIPGVLAIEWDDQVKTTIDTWSNYGITVAQFRNAILEKGVANARLHGGRAWIMDASKVQGAFPQEIQDLIAKEVFKTFASIGIKYFITIKSAGSAITNMSIKRYTAHLGPCGIQMVEVADRGKAIEWLREHH